MNFNWLIDRLHEDRNISTSLNEEKTILIIEKKIDVNHFLYLSFPQTSLP